MSNTISEGKSTVLFVRSSPVEHCLQLIKLLRETRHPDSTTRWLLIVQPQMEKSVREAFGPAAVQCLSYDQPRFTRRALDTAFGEILSGQAIQSAYVPWNNPEGKGYFHIIRFLTSLKIPKIWIHTRDGALQEMTLPRFLIGRIFSKIVWGLETIILIVSIPFLALYYFSRSMIVRLKNLFTRRQRFF